jgi:hypothetical protein
LRHPKDQLGYRPFHILAARHLPSLPGWLHVAARAENGRRVPGDTFQPSQIFPQQAVLLDAILKALQMPPQLIALLCGQLVNSPILVLSALNQVVLLQIRQMLGDVYLSLLQNAPKVADAQRRVRQ